ncbi:MAG: hypothetical protein HOW73_32295 [Polyangiaceae bacterium]|nr:hypothetical protein [Polyangiaceae bacterium]
MRGTLGEETCAAWIRNVRRAKKDWARDFGGEQFTLGRAFYTHYETERSDLYFRDAAASDRRVEQHLPGMQTWVTDLFARMVGATARKRMGFCGPGVHVFPAREKVAKHGGIVHYDVEGLTPIALARRHAALSLVVMLQVPEHGGGLRLYDVEYSGTESVSDEELKAPRATVRYRNGDALLMSSYRLHQIRPFRGTRDRVSITLHAEEVDRGVWETWF